jgi:hypothetical protein
VEDPGGIVRKVSNRSGGYIPTERMPAEAGAIEGDVLFLGPERVQPSRDERGAASFFVVRRAPAGLIEADRQATSAPAPEVDSVFLIDAVCDRRKKCGRPRVTVAATEGQGLMLTPEKDSTARAPLVPPAARAHAEHRPPESSGGHDPLLCGLYFSDGRPVCPACVVEDARENAERSRRLLREQLCPRPEPTREQLSRAFRLIRQCQADVDELALRLVRRSG